MARKDELAQRYPEFNITLLDILSYLDPTGKNKYLELFCKIWKIDLASSKGRVLDDKGKAAVGKFTTPMEQKFAAVLLDTYLKLHLDTLHKFIEYNERGAIPENDVSKYSNIEQVKLAVEEADRKKEEKELEKEILKVFESDEWLVIRPLSWRSSAKYGSGTKWCTTFNTDKSYFLKYSKKGPLIYVLNKKNGYKVAFHKDNDTSSEDGKLTTVWNAVDKKIDFIDAELSLDILDIVRKELKGKSNWDLTPYETQRRVNKEITGKDEHEDLMEILRGINNIPTPQPGTL